MKTISIDIETYSSVDLTKSGVYRYVESEDFEILLFAYSVDCGDVIVVDLACGEKIPDEILNVLEDESVLKWAYNAQFERVCLSKYLGCRLSPKSWRCSLVWAATLGLPLSLEDVGKVLGLENPNSVVQLKDWFAKNGFEIESLNKKEAGEVLKNCPENLKPVLELRNKLAKNSIKKYTAMKNAVCSDGRLRGMFRFYGANRTGRFAAKIVQLHNLPQNHIPDLDIARSLVRSGNYEALQLLYDEADTLSQLIRTAFVPQKGKKFIVADFSSIEARVLAWLAGERWRLKAFAEGKDIYCQSASQMFGVPVEKNGINGHLRQKGKIAELALGYGGSVVALKSMGALEMGLVEDELEPLVYAWRGANPMITNLWWEIDRAVRKTVKTGISREVNELKIFCMDRYLFMRLPSGRKLAYFNPQLDISKYDTELLTYDGVGKDRRWTKLESYGPKLVENVVQGIARDILLFAMQNLRQYKIVAHVHDEVIIEADQDDSVEDICEIMCKMPEWAKGLILKADGYECESYRKM